MTTLLAIFLPWSLEAQDRQLVEGSMRCNIEAITALASEDGLARTYAGVQGGASIGDNLVFSYEVSSISGAESGLFAAFYLQEDFSGRNFASYVAVSDYCPLLLGRQVENCFGDARVSEFAPKASEFRHGSIIIHDIETELRMFRYFRNDWGGILTTWMSGWGEEPLLQVATLECRDTTGSLNDAIDLAFSLLSRE